MSAFYRMYERVGNVVFGGLFCLAYRRLVPAPPADAGWRLELADFIVMLILMAVLVAAQAGIAAVLTLLFNRGRLS